VLLITKDKNMVYQQNNAKRQIALLVLSTNSRVSLRAAHERILAAVERSAPGSYEYLEL
jgi:hypothetical protein